MSATKKNKAELLSENEKLLKRIEKLKSEKIAAAEADSDIRIYKKVLENSPISIVITDTDGKIEFVNPFFSKLTGYSSKEIIGKNPSILSSGYHPQDFYKALWETITRGKIWRGEFLNKKKNGEQYWESATIGPVFNSKREITHYVGAKEDITERKKSEEKFKQLAEELPNMIFINRKGRIVYANKKCEEVMGFSKDEFYSAGFDFRSLIEPEYLNLIKEEFEKYIRGEETKTIEYAIRTKAGKRIDVLHSTKIIEFENSKALLGIITDITHLKDIEEKVRQSEQDYRGLFEEAHDLIIVFEPENEIILDVNQRACQVYGYRRSELIGMSLKELSKFVPRGEENIKKTLQDGTYKHFETIHYRKDGTEIQLEINASVVKYMGKRAILSINRDITERKKVEEKLRESEDRYRAVSSLTSDYAYAFRVESDGRLIHEWVAGALLNISGFTVEELKASGGWVSMIHPDDKHIPRNQLEAVLSGRSEIVEYRIITKDGKIRWTRDYARPIWDKEQNRTTYIYGAIQDITDRKLAEEELSRNEEKLRNIIEHSTNLFYSHTPDHILTYVSPQSKSFFGYEPDEAMVRWTKLVSDNPINQRGFEETVKAIETGERQPPYELELIKKDGSLAWVEVHEAPVVQNGKTTAIVGALTDITERKKAEEELHLKNIVFNSSIAANSIANKDGIITHVNSSFLKMWGYKNVKDVIGKPISYFFVREDDLSPIMNALREKGEWEGEFLAKKKDGSTFISRGLATVVIDIEGKVIGYQSTNLDITKRKFAERALLESERKLSTLIDNMPGMTYRCLMDEFWTMKFISKGCKKITGYSQLELLDNKELSYEDLIYSEDKEMVRREVFKTLDTQNQFELEYRIVRKDGSIRWVWERGLQIDEKLNGVPLLEGIIEDITEKKLAQEALKESEAKWRSLTENSPDIITLVNAEEKIQFINRTLPGVMKDELIGRNTIDTVPEEYRERARKCFKYVLNSGKTDSYTTIYYTESGEELYFQVMVGPVFKEKKIAGVVSSARDITPQKIAEKRIHESHTRLRNLAERLQMIREEERAAVSREIHDDLGQVLTALKMDISSLQSKSNLGKDELNARTEKMIELVNSSIQTVKRISTELRPGILDDLGLFPAIEWQVEEFQNRTGINCQLEIEGEMNLSEDEVSIAVFRIFQETLTNITRHANATQTVIKLFCSDKYLTLEVRDNGKGISAEQLYGPRSLGILGMRERVHILRGEFEISGEASGGTKVQVKIPLRNKEIR